MGIKLQRPPKYVIYVIHLTVIMRRALTCADKCCNILKTAEFPNLFKFVSCFFSIRSGSAFSQKCLVLWTHFRRDEQNTILSQTVKAELVVYINCKLSCADFLLDIGRNKITNRAKSNEKYTMQCSKIGNFRGNF